MLSEQMSIVDSIRIENEKITLIHFFINDRLIVGINTYFSLFTKVKRLLKITHN